MCASFCIYELSVYAKSITATLHRAFENVTNVQLAADVLEINSLAFIGECRVPADDE
jgi:hypothetical protein